MVALAVEAAGLADSLDGAEPGAVRVAERDARALESVRCRMSSAVVASTGSPASAVVGRNDAWAPVTEAGEAASINSKRWSAPVVDVATGAADVSKLAPKLAGIDKRPIVVKAAVSTIARPGWMDRVDVLQESSEME